MCTGTLTRGRRAVAGAFAATVLVMTLMAGAPPAHAATGSIVFVYEHNIWIMPADDPGAARPVTVDGSEVYPYGFPTQDDNGVIMAVHGYLGESQMLVRMDQSGNLLQPPFRPPGYEGIHELSSLDLSPDGTLLTLTLAAMFCSGDLCGGSSIVRADGTHDPSLNPPGGLSLNTSWYANNRVVSGNVDVNTYRVGDGSEQQWFRTCSFDSEWCLAAGEPEIDRGMRYLVGTDGGSSFSGPPVLVLWELNGPPPVEPTPTCLIGGHDSGGYYSPSWSPDGSSLVWELNEGGFGEAASGPTGIYRTTGIGSASCSQLNSRATLMLPGAHSPDWGPAPMGPYEPHGGPPPGGAPFDGDPGTTQRIDQGTGTGAAVAISQSRFPDDTAAHVVLSRDDAFPDSLAGATLTAHGPLLFTTTSALPDATLREVRRVLPAGGRVYLLGGEVAISAGVADRLRGEGFDVKRLSGPSRIETAIAIADEVRALNPDERRVGLARAFAGSSETSGWADSVTGGGWATAAGVPILVTQTDAVHPAVRAWLDADRPSQTVLFGGTAALSADVEAGVPSPRRVSGPERTATASAIATELWGARDTGARRFTVINGFRPDGWLFGLAAAGPAADYGAPLLMVTDSDVPAPTASLVRACGEPEVDLLLAGSTAVISSAVAGQLDRLNGGAC